MTMPIVRPAATTDSLESDSNHVSPSDAGIGYLLCVHRIDSAQVLNYDFIARWWYGQRGVTLDPVLFS